MALLTIRYFTYHSRMILMRVPTDLPLGLSSRGGMGGQGMRWDGRAGEGQEAGRRGDPQLVIFEKKETLDLLMATEKWYSTRSKYRTCL